MLKELEMNVLSSSVYIVSSTEVADMANSFGKKVTSALGVKLSDE